jgi:septum formation protein
VLVLASRSPQRRAILELLGVEFTVVVPDVEELEEGDPATLVVENARRKAAAVDAGGRPVLAVDTEVVLDGRVYGKPADERRAAEYLRALSGRVHEVHGGLVLRSGGAERTAHAVTRVRFRALDEAWLGWYLGTGEWRERAGGYAIQGRGAALVEGIDGDPWNVVGLPVPELVAIAPELVIAPARG